MKNRVEFDFYSIESCFEIYDVKFLKIEKSYSNFLSEN